MHKYLVFWKDQMEEAIYECNLDTDADDADAVQKIRHRFYHANDRCEAAKMYSDDEYNYWAKANDMYPIYQPTIDHLVELVDCNEFVDGVAITDKNRGLFAEINEKLEKIYNENGGCGNHSKLKGTIAESYDPHRLPDYFSEEEIKILYYDTISIDLGIILIEEEKENSVSNSKDEHSNKFFWEE
ncbi:MAG: hypothetical protein E7301_09050 [Butyrivibrio sp.]|nr:hypothetical protein [Butyrivibrio sp.]